MTVCNVQDCMHALYGARLICRPHLAHPASRCACQVFTGSRASESRLATGQGWQLSLPKVSWQSSCPDGSTNVVVGLVGSNHTGRTSADRVFFGFLIW